MVLEGQRFGRLLLGQAARDDVIGQLAQAALQDGRFPKDGDYERVRRHLVYAGADSELLWAIEELAQELQPPDMVQREHPVREPSRVESEAPAAPPAVAAPAIEQAEDFSLLLAGEPRDVAKPLRTTRRRLSSEDTPQLALPLADYRSVTSTGDMG